MLSENINNEDRQPSLGKLSMSARKSIIDTENKETQKETAFLAYGRQSIDDADVSAVCSVLQSDRLTQGPEVDRFESALCEKLNAPYAVAVANGTAALHLTGLALGWRAGDVVITSPLTFLATANCILYAGARPDFSDIDAVSYTLEPNRLEEKIKSYKKHGRSVKAVIGVDYAGNPCNWPALRELADRYDFQLVDDACHALGAKYEDDMGYAVKYADVAVYSFHPVKLITTGEGGAAITQSADLSEKMRCLRTHGTTKDSKYLCRNEGPWYYEMHHLGFNYRITEIQCALGVSQLNKLDSFLAKRKEVAHFYDRFFDGDERFVCPQAGENVSHAYHLYPLQIRFDMLGVDKKIFFRYMSKKNIVCQVHYIPIHLQPYYQKEFGFNRGDFPEAEQFYAQEVSIPIYPDLSQAHMRYVASTISENLTRQK